MPIANDIDILRSNMANMAYTQRAAVLKNQLQPQQIIITFID